MATFEIQKNIQAVDILSHLEDYILYSIVISHKVTVFYIFSFTYNKTISSDLSFDELKQLAKEINKI